MSRSQGPCIRSWNPIDPALRAYPDRSGSPPRRHASPAGAGVDAPPHLPPGARARKALVFRAQRTERRGIALGACALMDDLAVPVKLQALELGEDRGAGAGNHPGGVEVVDADQPLVAPGTGVEKARHRGDDRAEVQLPGRRRREAAPAARAPSHPVPVLAGGGTHGLECSEDARAVAPFRPAILILLVGSRGRTGTTVDLPPICPGSSR